MGIGTGIAIYFIIWWTTIFITLPFRMKPQFETGEVVPGTEESAPTDPQIFRRMVWNTLISGVIFAIYWLVFYYFDYGLDDIPDFLTGNLNRR